MFPNLKAEMARRNITQQKLAELTGQKPLLIHNKLNGKSEISFILAKEIKSAIGTDVPLEVLFEKGE